MSLSKTEEIELARLLGKMEWPLPKEVFHALVPKIITVPIELAVFNKNGFVLMLPRPEDDIEFTPGTLHMPGTVVRLGETIEHAMERLLSGEVVSTVSPPRELGYLQIGQDLAPTRPALSLLFATRLLGPHVGKGAFYDPVNLPDQTMTHHRVLISNIMSRVRDVRL